MSSRLFTLVAITLFVFCGCAGQSSVSSGLAPSEATRPNAADGAHGLPGGNGYVAFPGESAKGLPGATFACSPATISAQAQCMIAINLNVKPNPNPNLPAVSIPGYHPNDLASAYGLPVGAGLHRTVAIVDAFDDPTAEADLAVYRAAFGLPACTSLSGCFSKVNQRGQNSGYPTLDAGWAQEVALDLDMVSAACPNCKLLLVEADSSLIDDLGASVDTAATFRPIAISNSYFAWEWPTEGSEEVHYHHPGIAITVSSGDHHFESYPAASRFVTAVGGTSLSNGPRSWSEQAWKFSGGGCSAYIPKAFAQDGSTCTTRAAIDVAAVGDPNTGVAVYSSFSDGWIVAGGTSVGAPLIAAGYALAGQGNPPNYSYAHEAAFHDIPPMEYDLRTGLGTPAGIGGL